MIVCNRRVYDGDNLIYETEFASNISYTIDSVENYFYKNFFKYTPVCYNKIYRRELLAGIEFVAIKEVGSEDAFFNFEIMPHLKKVSEVREVFYNNLARQNSTARSYQLGMLIQNYNLLNKSLIVAEKNKIDKEICYCLFNFFQQRTWSQIKNYAVGEALKELYVEINDIKKIRDYRNICLNMLKLKKLNKMGYRFKGIVAIKIMYLLKLLDLNKFLVKYIYCLFIRGRV